MEKARLNRLIKKLKQGKKEYFDEFYDLTKGAVYYKIKSYSGIDKQTAEDVMQETYISFVKNLHVVGEDKNPLAYLLTVAGNKTVDELRKRKKIDKDAEVEALPLKTEESYSHDTPLLESCRKKLKPEDYKIIELTVIFGYKRVEVAKIIGKPVSTVNRRYNDLLKIIKTFFKEAYR